MARQTRSGAIYNPFFGPEVESVTAANFSEAAVQEGALMAQSTGLRSGRLNEADSVSRENVFESGTTFGEKGDGGIRIPDGMFDSTADTTADLDGMFNSTADLDAIFSNHDQSASVSRATSVDSGLRDTGAGDLLTQGDVTAGPLRLGRSNSLTGLNSAVPSHVMRGRAFDTGSVADGELDGNFQSFIETTRANMAIPDSNTVVANPQTADSVIPPSSEDAPNLIQSSSEVGNNNLGASPGSISAPINLPSSASTPTGNSLVEGRTGGILGRMADAFFGAMTNGPRRGPRPPATPLALPSTGLGESPITPADAPTPPGSSETPQITPAGRSRSPIRTPSAPRPNRTRSVFGRTRNSAPNFSSTLEESTTAGTRPFSDSTVDTLNFNPRASSTRNSSRLNRSSLRDSSLNQSLEEGGSGGGGLLATLLLFQAFGQSSNNVSANTQPINPPTAQPVNILNAQHTNVLPPFRL